MQEILWWIWYLYADEPNIQERDEGARLLRPEELRGLSNDDCVLLIQDSDPVLAQKVRYFEDRVLNPIFEGQVGAYPLPDKLAFSRPANLLSQSADKKGSQSSDSKGDDDIWKWILTKLRLHNQNCWS